MESLTQELRDALYGAYFVCVTHKQTGVTFDLLRVVNFTKTGVVLYRVPHTVELGTDAADASPVATFKPLPGGNGALIPVTTAKQPLLSEPGASLAAQVRFGTDRSGYYYNVVLEALFKVPPPAEPAAAAKAKAKAKKAAAADGSGAKATSGVQKAKDTARASHKQHSALKQHKKKAKNDDDDEHDAIDEYDDGTGFVVRGDDDVDAEPAEAEEEAESSASDSEPDSEEERRKERTRKRKAKKAKAAAATAAAPITCSNEVAPAPVVAGVAAPTFHDPELAAAAAAAAEPIVQ